MDIIEELASYSKDPLGFVMFAFPWGEKGTELEDEDGPEPWQREELEQIGESLQEGKLQVLQARASGHGVGKSALTSWLSLWAMSTFEDTRGVVTANTENQLKTKTWVELAKWYRMFIGKQFFRMTATALFSRDPDHLSTWRIDQVPWSERNTEAFAGMHNKSKRIIIIFDEASAIPDLIWEVTEGALTDEDTEIIWACFGNPTRNTGRFRECFKGGRFAHRWKVGTVDARQVSLTNKEQIQKWIDDYGEDHDFVRVRVYGTFPRVDATSFISLELAREASLRVLADDSAYSNTIVLGVDVGRFGDDPSVIYPRRGRDARTLPIEIYGHMDLMTLAGKVVAAFNKHGAKMVFVDEGGVGGGLIDRLLQLGLPVIAVNFGSKPDEVNPGDRTLYANKRAEIWGAVREWLKTGSIPDMVRGSESGLVDELTGPSFGLNVREAIQLESKKEMRRRGVPSPNMADALACTFAFPVHEEMTGDIFRGQKPVQAKDYNPYDHSAIFG